jgi:hypothetical protein
MKRINKFDKNNLKALRVEMDSALESISKRFGITIKTGNASFSGNECTFKVKLNTKGTDGTVITKESMDWDRHKGLHGMDHLNVGDPITIQGNRYTLSGFNTRARKAPVNFTNDTGMGFKCSIQMLANENSK